MATEKTYVGCQRLLVIAGKTFVWVSKDAVPSTWSVYECVLVDDPHTNNFLKFSRVGTIGSPVS